VGVCVWVYVCLNTDSSNIIVDGVVKGMLESKEEDVYDYLASLSSKQFDPIKTYLLNGMAAETYAPVNNNSNDKKNNNKNKNQSKKRVDSSSKDAAVVAVVNVQNSSSTNNNNNNDDNDHNNADNNNNNNNNNDRSNKENKNQSNSNNNNSTPPPPPKNVNAIKLTKQQRKDMREFEVILREMSAIDASGPHLKDRAITTFTLGSVTAKKKKKRRRRKRRRL